MNHKDLKMDPKKAWSPFKPTKSRPWDFQAVAHLHRRAGFSATRERITIDVKKSPGELVDSLLEVKDQAFEDQLKIIGRTILASREPKNLSAYWLYRMLFSPRQLLEKTTLFWHGHFATSAAKVTEARLMLSQNEMLRQNAFGSFETMVKAISRDPAMLIYLDSTDNRRTHPNENYSRELMELFCLGLGNYSEKDIQEIARCFTGWEMTKNRFRFNDYQHDKGVKKFLGASGNFGGEQAVKIVLKQPACARFIARKLTHFFVIDEPVVSDEFIEPLAETIRKSNYQIKPVLKQILSSNFFFSHEAIGRKIKSPIEFTIGFLRQTSASVSLYELANRLEELGQIPFYPPNVKGWIGGRNWINSSTVLSRANSIKQILESEETKWRDGDMSAWIEKLNADSTADKVDAILENFLCTPVEDSVRKELVALAETVNFKDSFECGKLIHAVSLLPEFQLN